MRNSGRVKVRNSNVGRGVFAGKAFRADEQVGTVKGELITDPEYTSEYCIDLGNGTTLEPRRPFRYLNHCCEPNCGFFYYEHEPLHDGVRSLYVHSLRAIDVGEELTIDYAWPASAAIPCLCGHINCRGWFVNLEELALVESRELVAV